MLLLFIVGGCNSSEEQQHQRDKGSQPATEKDTSQLSVLNRKIVQDPQDPAPYLERASFYEERGKYEQAVNDVERALSLDSSQADFHFRLGKLYYKQQRFEKAEKTLKKCLSLNEDHARALTYLGQIQLVLRQYKHALEYVNKALRADQYLAQPYYLKGFIYKELGDTSRAVSSFQTAVERDPEYYEAYVLLGLIHARQGDDLAIEYYNTASRLRPEKIEPLYNKAKFCQDHGLYNRALRTYDELLEVDSTHINALYNMGYINLEYLKNYEGAVPYFTRATEMEPRYYQAYYNRGLCYEKMGDLKAARSDYQKALDLKGDFDLAARGMNRVEGK